MSGSSLGPNEIYVSPRQKGNPLLGYISNVKCVLENSLVPDFILGPSTCALFLSIKYHMLNPNYLYTRINPLKNMFKCRVLLVYVDAPDCEAAITEVSMIAVTNKWTLMLCWSLDEAGRYLETYRLYEKRTADMLKGKAVMAPDHKTQVQDNLTTIRILNKTDVTTLMSEFGSYAAIAKSSKEALTELPGFGSKKVHQLHSIFRQPIVSKQRAGERKRQSSSSSSSRQPISSTSSRSNIVIENNTELQTNDIVSLAEPSIDTVSSPHVAKAPDSWGLL